MSDRKTRQQTQPNLQEEGGGNSNKKKPPLKRTTTNKDPPKRLPILDMDLKSLKEYLNSRILHQGLAMEKISKLLSKCSDSYRAEEVRDRMIKVFISGVSGTGKTTTCIHLRKLLLMGEGEMYENQFIRVDLNTCNNSTDLIGASASFVGHGEKKSFASRYHAACLGVDGNPPPFIFVLFDEYDKAIGDIDTTLLTFLQSGSIKATEEIHSSMLPRETMLIVFMTANYAEGLIEPNQFDKSVEYIKEDMIAKNLEYCNIRRLGTIIPFPPPSKEQVAEMLELHHLPIVKKAEYYRRYGEISMNECDQKLFINHIVHSYQPREGFAGILELYEEELNSLFEDTTCLFRDKIPRDQSYPLSPSPEFKFTTTELVDDRETFLTNNQLIKEALDESANNKARFDTCINQSLPLHYISITFKRITGPITALCILKPANQKGIYS